MPYNPREIEDVKKKQRKATGNVVTNVQSPATITTTEEPSEGIAERAGRWGTPLKPIEFPPGSGEYPGYTGGAGDTGGIEDTGTTDDYWVSRMQDISAQLPPDSQLAADIAAEQADYLTPWLQQFQRLPPNSRAAVLEGAGMTEEDVEQLVLAHRQSPPSYDGAKDALRQEAPHVQDIELEQKSASTTAPHYAKTWSIGQVDAPVLPGFKAPKTLTWTDATGVTTESPVWSDVWQMNDMFDPHDIKASLNIKGKPYSVQVGTRFTNGDEVTDIELAPVRVGPGEGQEVGVWRIRMTPESEDDQDYFIYSEDVDASQIVEGGEAATSRASEKGAARKKAEADAAATDDTTTTRDDLLVEVIPPSLNMGKGDLRYRMNVQAAYDKTLEETKDEQAALDAAHGARNASAKADLEKWSAEVGVKSVTSRDDPFERTTLNDGQVYIESPEGDVYNISGLSDQEVDKFYVNTYDDTAWQRN